MISIKGGVSILGFKPEALLGLIIASSVFDKHDVDLIITSGGEGEHSRGSLHFSGLGFDLRSKHLVSGLKKVVLRDLRQCLGKNFDVVLEKRGKPNEHFHIEYQPKKASGCT